MNDFLKWRQLSIELKKLKKDESVLRRKLCENLLNNGNVPRLIGEYKFKATATMNYSVDTPAVTAMWKKLSFEEKLALKWKAELVVSKYNELPENCLLKTAVVIKDGMPKLEWKEII